MEKKIIPVLNIQERCEDINIRNFKVASFDELTCTATEFEENHRHDYFEIIWLKNGTGVHQIDLKDHYYEGSVMFMIAPGQIHQIHQQNKSKGYVIKFLPSVFSHEKDFSNYILDTCLFDNQNSCQIIPVSDHLHSLFEDLFSHLVHEFHNPEFDSDNILSSYLKILITHINRIKRKKTSEEAIVNHPQYALFREFKLAVEKHYREEHSVQGYADLLNTGTRALNTVSRKYSNKSAGEIIQERILLEARRRLYHESKSIKEICYELGFEDPAYFTRFFKKHTGIAPLQFKEEIAAAV